MEDIENVDIEIKQKGKTFKERYNSDEEYKNKHNAYIKEKIECECGKMVMRVAMAKHRKTGVHQRLVGEKTKKENVLENSEIEELVNRIVQQKLKKLLKNNKTN